MYIVIRVYIHTYISVSVVDVGGVGGADELVESETVEQSRDSVDLVHR